MGVDINIKIYKYNRSTNFYDEIQLFRRRKPNEKFKYYDEEGNGVPFEDDYRPIYIEVGRDYEMFDGMRNDSGADGYGNFPISPISLESFNPESKAELERIMKINGYYDFYEISLAEMKLYTFEHPTVVDYDAHWNDEEEEEEEDSLDKRPRKVNPIKGLYEDIFNYIYLAENCWMDDALSFYKIVFFWDC